MVLTRVDTLQRRAMKTERECNLTYLTFESGMTQVTMIFYAWKGSPRKPVQNVHLDNIHMSNVPFY